MFKYWDIKRMAFDTEANSIEMIGKSQFQFVFKRNFLTIFFFLFFHFAYNNFEIIFAGAW